MNMDQQIDRAVAVLRQGGVVAYPNDTVYSLGVAISRESAVRRVYEIKGRDCHRPLLIAVADFEMLVRYCRVTGEELNALRQIWPGAISVLLPKLDGVTSAVTAGRPLVGVRMPNYPPLRELIKKLGEPITTTSANLSGQPDSIEAEEINLPVDLVIRGSCQWKKPSTLVDLKRRQILRRGAEVERAERWLRSLSKSI